MPSDSILTQAGPIDSAAWRNFEVAIGQNGIQLRINGEDVSVDDFQKRMAELKEFLSPMLLDTFAFVRREGEATARHLAEGRGLNMTTACMRLKRGWEIGVFTRERSGLSPGRVGGANNEYIYKVVTNRDA